MTQLNQLFAKKIDRPIEGVIKADDEAHLRLEVEEYVLTNEVAKRLEKFLEAYNDYQGANGVWISGFFGSGKSHLLKMLALLLENRTVDGQPVLEMFGSKVADNPFLRAELERAASIPSRSILFNIDQKADVISKTEFDALLAVFVKVFDEMCGYYGKQGHIAQFERDLDSRGQYGAFQKAYREIAGYEWSHGREQALLEGENIAQAFARATGASPESARGILDKYRAEYRVSIEDFAEMVHDYIQSQAPDFRLNFFVDEVGQYIADNVKLMTNLQTVAESLATKCRGRAWIVVTAQEEMQRVFGEEGGQQSDDFSKIQARFNNRLKLTSADVAEVIQKRLLLKNEQGEGLLARLYEAQQNNFKTLFDFAEGGQTYRNFRDREHFVRSYPFIPYQFVLFQSAIQSLSEHNAFEGKHSSVGERSMLAVFQQVAMQISGHKVGQLATFDLMFEGIRTALKSQVQRSVLTAESNLEDAFAVRVLKALFLVKYVKEFRPIARNVTVLMLDSFDTELPTLRRRVQEALDLLEQQTYVQRNGEAYEYLTDEEKDVEQEIKNTSVEIPDVVEELGKLLFDRVIRERKIRFEDNGLDYNFARKVDDRLLGRDYELTIHIISPLHEHAGNDAVLRAQAMGRDELLVLLPVKQRLASDLMMYKKTDRYVRQNLTATQQDSVRRILADKQHQNQSRYRNLETLVEELLSEATLVVDGQEVAVNGSEARSRIVRGFQQLVTRTYPNLRMLRGVDYSTRNLSECFRQSVTLYGDDGATFSEAEQELLAFIQRNKNAGLRTTMQGLVTQFERKPYGWPLAAIQCNLAKLCARGKVEVRRDANILEDQELEHAVANTRDYGNLLLDPQIDFSPAVVRWLRDFYAHFFDGPPQNNEAKALGKETAEAFRALHTEVAQLRTQAGQYPFLKALAEPLQQIDAVTNKPYTFYLTALPEHEDDLFDAKEQILDPVRRFMSGAQREIYDRARTFLERETANFSYVDGQEANRLRAILDGAELYAGNQMQEAKQLMDTLKAAVEECVALERQASMEQLRQYQRRLENTKEFAVISEAQQEVLRAPFKQLDGQIGEERLIAMMRDTVRTFESSKYLGLLHTLDEWANLSDEDDDEDGESAIGEVTVQYVTGSSLAVKFDKAWLESEEDVDKYLAALKQTFMKAIEDGKRVQI